MPPLIYAIREQYLHFMGTTCNFERLHPVGLEKRKTLELTIFWREKKFKTYGL